MGTEDMVERVEATTFEEKSPCGPIRVSFVQGPGERVEEIIVTGGSPGSEMASLLRGVGRLLTQAVDEVDDQRRVLRRCAAGWKGEGGERGMGHSGILDALSKACGGFLGEDDVESCLADFCDECANIKPGLAWVGRRRLCGGCVKKKI